MLQEGKTGCQTLEKTELMQERDNEKKSTYICSIVFIKEICESTYLIKQE